MRKWGTRNKIAKSAGKHEPGCFTRAIGDINIHDGFADFTDSWRDPRTEAQGFHVGSV